VRVLVTGATGFIGAELCVHLLKMGHEVVAVGRSEERLERLQAYVPAGRGQFTALPGSLESLRNLPQGVNAVIHAAAVRESEALVSPALAIETNVGGTVHLLDVANIAGAQRFILLSSQSIYGKADPPWREDQRPAPHGVYALSKYAAEQAVLKRLTEVEPVILRISRVYGTGLFMRWDELIGRLVRRASVGQAIEVYGNGLQRMDLVHIRDLAEVIGMLLDYRNTLPNCVYNIGGGGSVTFHEIAEAVQEAAASAGLEPPTIEMHPEVTPSGPPHLELDISRIRHDLHWEPRICLRQGIQESFIEQQKHDR